MTKILDVLIFEFSFITVDRFWGVPKQRKLPFLDAGYHPDSLLHMLGHGAYSHLLNEFGPTKSCEA